MQVEIQISEDDSARGLNNLLYPHRLFEVPLSLVLSLSRFFRQFQIYPLPAPLSYIYKMQRLI